MHRVLPAAPFLGPPTSAIDLDRLRRAYSRTLAERDPLRADVDQAAMPALDGREGAQTFLRWLVDRAGEQIDAAERILALIGLDPDRVTAASGGERVGGDGGRPGLGGPFVPFTVGEPSRGRGTGLDLSTLDLSIERWRDLRRTLHRLPLGSPVGQAAVGSRFGPRTDPINGRRAFHGGVDIRGSRGTEILATGSGVVTFAGRRGRYGRLVEIDHGNGVTSLYAHLDRIKVAKGDIVSRRTVVGAMGASGRTTGVHLHYEVRVDGEARDPNRFLTAGRYVPSQ